MLAFKARKLLEPEGMEGARAAVSVTGRSGGLGELQEGRPETCPAWCLLRLSETASLKFRGCLVGEKVWVRLL
jgi:hypothetical protein